ncbi:exlusion protein FxsA [Vibrio cholerae]|nr:exlusion protein FxsA [Vibrio cholerae]
MSTRGVSSPNEPRWLQLLRLSFVVMRRQPLRRALCLRSKIWKITSET